MTTPTHTAAGFLVAEGLVRSNLVPAEMLPNVYLTSMILANLPDLDAIVLGKIYDHRTKSPFHYPFTWWAILITATVTALATEQKWLLPYIALAALNIFIHFILDTFAVTAGICWLAPFYYKEFSFIRFTKITPKNFRELWRRYAKHPVTWLEVVIWLSALFVVRHPTVYARLKANVAKPQDAQEVRITSPRQMLPQINRPK